MPGLFGAVGVPPGIGNALRQQFEFRWPDLEVVHRDEAILGGQAFGDAKAVHAFASGAVVAVDGERAIYSEITALVDQIQCADEHLGEREANLVSVGNLAWLGAAGAEVYLQVDTTGTFPLYYAQHADGLLFSSLIRPLAATIEAVRDDLAVLEFLRQAYTVGGKTVYRSIRRLLPGQTLHFIDREVRVAERSCAWVGQHPADPAAAAEQAWTSISRAVQRSMGESAALMMSGGWDSRTLLAAASTLGQKVVCYTHGDPKAREIDIVRSLCRTVDAPLRVEAIDDRVLDLDLLGRGFKRTETAVFPHWHRAGALLAEQPRVIAAGVFGEILGGHYGPAMLAGAGGKILSVGGMLLGLHHSGGQQLTARDYLHVRSVDHTWYLRREFEQSIEEPREQLNEAVDAAVDRLERRGVVGDLALVEAFVSEHRGTQYINAQLLSCRSATDIALPFAGGEIFTLSTRLPLEIKIHNVLNRKMLADHAPVLLRQPLAATLVPAGAPLLVQEISRAARKAYEVGRMRLYGATRGAIPRPRLGWVNFEFVRNSRGLREIVEDLRSDIWDHAAISKRVDGLAEETDPRVLHPVYDQMSKIYTADLLIR